MKKPVSGNTPFEQSQFEQAPFEERPSKGQRFLDCTPPIRVKKFRAPNACEWAPMNTLLLNVLCLNMTLCECFFL